MKFTNSKNLYLIISAIFILSISSGCGNDDEQEVYSETVSTAPAPTSRTTSRPAQHIPDPSPLESEVLPTEDPETTPVDEESDVSNPDEPESTLLVRDIPVDGDESIPMVDGKVALLVTVINNTGVSIDGLFSSFSGLEDWGKNIIVSSSPLPSNGKTDVTIFLAPTNVVLDFAIENSDGTIFEVYGVDFSIAHVVGSTLTLRLDSSGNLITTIS